MIPPPASWFDVPVQVATFEGTGATGPVRSAPVSLNANTSQGGKFAQTAIADVNTTYTVWRFPASAVDVVTLDSTITDDSGVPRLVVNVRKYRAPGRLIYIEATTT